MLMLILALALPLIRRLILILIRILALLRILMRMLQLILQDTPRRPPRCSPTCFRLGLPKTRSEAHLGVLSKPSRIIIAERLDLKRMVDDSQNCKYCKTYVSSISIRKPPSEACPQVSVHVLHTQQLALFITPSKLRCISFLLEHRLCRSSDGRAPAKSNRFGYNCSQSEFS